MLGERAIPTRPMREDWETPQPVFDALDAEFHFTVDGAATASNTKCARFWPDAFAAEWAREVVWLNPPYGHQNLRRWMRHAWEASRAGATVCCLVPATTSCVWWHEWVIGKASDIRWIKGRLRFAGAPFVAPFSSCIVIYRASATDEETMDTFDFHRLTFEEAVALRLGESRMTEPPTDSKDSARLYDELLYAMGLKWAHESRHQTALRYIQAAERNTATAAMQSALPEPPKEGPNP